MARPVLAALIVDNSNWATEFHALVGAATSKGLLPLERRLAAVRGITDRVAALPRFLARLLTLRTSPERRKRIRKP
jgi:hypothetical protein